MSIAQDGVAGPRRAVALVAVAARSVLRCAVSGCVAAKVRDTRRMHAAKAARSEAPRDSTRIGAARGVLRLVACCGSCSAYPAAHSSRRRRFALHKRPGAWHGALRRAREPGQCRALIRPVRATSCGARCPHCAQLLAEHGVEANRSRRIRAARVSVRPRSVTTHARP